MSLSTDQNIHKVCNNLTGFETSYCYKWAWVKEDEVIDKEIITIRLEKYNEK